VHRTGPAPLPTPAWRSRYATTRQAPRSGTRRHEHRLFSFITMNWRGRPPTSYRVIVELIANTTTRKGLRVRAELDQGHYPTGVKVSKKELPAVPLTPHDWLGEGNYAVHSSPLN